MSWRGSAFARVGTRKAHDRADTQCLVKFAGRQRR
jgi:hypothetical protein